MTDPCERFAQQIISEHPELTSERAWSWDTQFQEWRWLENEPDDNDSNSLLDITIRERAEELARGVTEAEAFYLVQATDFNPMTYPPLWMDWSGQDFKSTIEVIRYILDYTIYGLVIKLIPKPEAAKH